MIRLVVFDLDGTLVDSAPQIVASMRAGYAAAGRRPPSEPEILSIVGLSLPRAVERLSPGILPAERDVVVTAYRVAFQADPAVPPLYPGAAETLAALAARPDLKLAVATGKTRRGLVKVLDQHGLRPLFDTLHAGDEHPSKPDPAMLRAAMAEADVTPKATIMVGDSVFDVEMARAAGVRCVAVRWGYYACAELVAAGASHVLAGFGDLPGLLSDRREPAA